VTGFQVTLNNPGADRVRQVAKLAARSARQRHGQFLVEGPQGVREAVRYAADRVRDVYMTPEAADRYSEIVQYASDGGIYLHIAAPDVLAAMSPDTQGVLAVVHTRVRTLEEALSALPAARLVAVLAHVRDPGNAGTVIRTADAAGADLVVLAGETVDIHNPKTVRSTAGSLFHLPVVTDFSLSYVTRTLRAAGLTLLAADGAGNLDLDVLLDDAASNRTNGSSSGNGSSDGNGSSTDGLSPQLTSPTAWIFGNEAWGLSDADRALADAVVRVPIHGKAESLNLATAATVCLYASARAQRN
jgi:TrmH family RNA methyltransferase